MNSLSQQIKLLTDTLGNQISESLVVDPIITQEEPSFIENFIENNQTLANIYKVVRDKDGFNAITTNFSGKIQQILNSNEIITPNLARFASIYLQALIKCMDCVKISSTQELFDNSTLEIYISLIEKALNHDNPEILRSSYTKFAQTIGSKSSKIFSIFNEQIKAMLAKKPPNNVVRLQLVSFTRFISCYAALSLAIPLLLELFNDFKLYMAEYCHVVSTIIMQAYRISPEDFQERQINLKQASQIYELIKKDKSVPDHVKWEALVSLVFLLHDFIKTGQFDPISAQISAEITKKVMKFDIQHFNALQAALYSALIVAEMNGNPTYVAIFKNFASPIAEKFHTMQASLFENYHKLRYFLCVDFPVALYFTNYLQFVDIFPYFTTEYTIIPRPLTCRIIDKCMSSKMNGEQRTLMFSAVVNMLESLSSTTDILESFPLIFHTFEINPDILYKILTGNHGLCTFLWRPCPTNGIRSLCNSFISAFSIPIFTLTDWMVIDCTISSILNCSDFFMALKPEIIADLGRVFKFIINTIREYFANEDKRKYIQVQQMMVTVMQLEVLSLNFMPTPLSAVCIEMLETVVEIIEANKSEVIVSIPSDVYKEFIAEFKKTGKFDINSDRNFLPLLKIPTENTVIAYAYIKHIGNMASALDPQVFKDEERKFSNALSPAVLREEFSITVLLFETLVLKTPPQTFLGILNCCLSSPSYIGTTGASLFARLARPEFITPTFQSVLMKMQEIGWNFTDVNTQYCANAMRMTQLLIAKEEWIVDKVEIFLIVQLTMIFASYMNMLVSAQRLYQCSEFIIVSVNRGGSNFKAKNRLELAFILASWLSRIECGPSTEKAGASICNAIAKVVEDVPFSLDNYNDLLFLTTCLNKRLEKQPSLHASIGNAIASLFKSNFWLFSRSELAKTLIGTELSRANYLFAAKEALVNSTLLPPKKEENLIDFLFNNNFKVLAEIVSIVPQKLAEGFGNDLVMAAVSRHVELEFISMMIELELLNTTDKTKNTILRGNGVPSRSIMAFAKIFGSEWLKTIYNPMSEIAKDVVSKGKSLNIKTGRLSPNESMEENRKTFREVFIKAIDVITAAIPKLPTQIIKMVQIVYEKVTEKFGSHGTMIVNGIIFLRLIIPNLTAPAPDELNVSEEARQCLVSVCIALMAASLRGDLSDKGEDYIMFNDVAALALDRFTAAVNDIIKTDISGAAFKWIETDENSLCLSLASVISSTPRDLEIFMRDHKEENCDERKMFDFCMKQVAKTKKYRPMRETDNIFSSLPRDIKEYVTSIPSEEETELLKECVFIDTPDDSPYDVVYFVSSRIPQNISDKTLYSYLFHVLASIPGNYHLIIDVPTLDVEKYLPKGPMIKKFIPILDIAMKNAVSIKVIRSNYEFAEYFHQFRSLSHYSDLFIFVTSKIDLRPLQGLSDKMPVECHHAYDDNGAPQVTIINQRERQSELQDSVFILCIKSQTFLW